MARVCCTPSPRRILAGVLLVAACGGDRAGPTLPADFLLTTADSSYWVTSGPTGVRVRSAPILIARVDGRLSELYTTDVERTYFDAVFVGQRLFIRDLVRGDSTELMSDTTVAALEQRFRREHPAERLLDADEDPAADPSISAAASIDILDVHGPYVSFEYHTDVDLKRSRPVVDRHAGRRGVLDARTRHAVTLAQLFGEAPSVQVVRAATEEWRAASLVLAEHADSAGRLAAASMRGFAVDATSFSLDARDGKPLVVMAVPGSRRGTPTEPVALTPQPVAMPAWWRDVQPTLPAGSDSVRRWTRTSPQGTAHVTARSTDREHARLVVRDNNAREWDLGLITAPVQHVLWLDHGITAEDRRALERAFDDAASSGGSTQVATRTPRSPFIHANTQPSDPNGARVRAHELRPHDADGRERPGPRVRRHDPESDRQNRGGLRHAPRPRVGRHGVDGQSRFPRTDPRG